MSDAPSGSAQFLGWSLLVMLCSPLIYEGGRRVKVVARFLHGLVLSAVGALVLFVLLPEVVQLGGALSLLFAFAGLLTPLALERLHRDTSPGALGLGWTLAGLGLVMHTLVDGMALAPRSSQGLNLALGLAVALHQLPVSLGLWWLLRPRYGWRYAAGALGALAVFMVVGYVLGAETLSLLSGTGLAWFQAFLAGFLLHIIAHNPADSEVHTAAGQWHVAEVAGFVGGLLMVALLPNLVGHPEPHGAELASFGERLLHLGLDTAPALLLGFALAGLISSFMPQTGLSWLGGGGATSQAVRGVLFGLPLPVCSCGVLPLYASLVKRGVPAAGALAFLVATPELGIDSLLLSLPLLGRDLTLARLVGAVVVALAVGILLGRWVPRPAAGAVPTDLDEKQGTVAERFKRAINYGFSALPDDTAAWIIAGLCVAAAVDTSSLEGLLEGLPPGVDVFLAALAGIPLYVCASGATPLAAALILAGVSPGAAVAFLLAGPATNVTTFALLSQLHGRKFALMFGVTMVLLAMSAGLVVDGLLTAESVRTVLTHRHPGVSLYQWASLVVMGVLFLGTLLRLGPQAMIQTVVLGDLHEHEEGDEHSHGHGHSHEHGHSHGEPCCETHPSGMVKTGTVVPAPPIQLDIRMSKPTRKLPPSAG